MCASSALVAVAVADFDQQGSQLRFHPPWNSQTETELMRSFHLRRSCQHLPCDYLQTGITTVELDLRVWGCAHPAAWRYRDDNEMRPHLVEAGPCGQQYLCLHRCPKGFYMPGDYPPLQRGREVFRPKINKNEIVMSQSHEYLCFAHLD